MDRIKPTTEQSSSYENLDRMSVAELLQNMNKEDKSVPLAVEKQIPKIEQLVEVVVSKMQEGGRLFYIGAGTSGRLGVLDASEIPPTFGVSGEWIIGLIAGGDTALRNAVENAEDDLEQAWKDLQRFHISNKDVLVGIAASGTTPYVIGGVKKARLEGVVTGCITCNEGSPLAKEAEFPIECVVGPEFVTGSTRMKAGTAQKLILNMISTSTLIKMGRVKGNKMIDMQLSNQKLVKRGVEMIVEELGIEEEKAQNLLNEYGSVRNVLKNFQNNK